MTTITFDTLAFSKQLQEAGIPKEHAEAFVRVQKATLDEVVNSQEFTKKQDLLAVKTELKQEIAEAKHELLKWLIGISMAQTALIVAMIAFM